MRHFILYIFVPVFISLSVLVDCGGLRELDKSKPGVIDEREMTFYFDWSDMEEKPTGMTVLLYPESGGKPYKFISNNVDSLVAVLPYQKYHIITFNQTVEEFSSVGFRGLDSWETAEAYVPETPLDPSSRKINTSVRMQTSSVASASAPVAMKSRAVVDTTHHYIKPKNRVHPMEITVYVKGLEYVNNLTASISGLSSGYMLGKEILTDNELEQELDDWDFHASTSKDQPGTVTISFGVWGIKALTDETPGEPEPVVLEMEFTLNNGEKVNYDFQVQDYITVVEDKFEDETTVAVDLVVGTDMPDNRPPLEIIPTEGGLQVRPWGKPTEVEVHF